jgi:Fic family protein
MIKLTPQEVTEFLKESNAIEREYSDIALKDAKIAWSWAWKYRDQINVKYVLNVHCFLLLNVNPKIAGKLRDYGVKITYKGKVTTIPFVSEKHLKDKLESVLTVMRYQQVEELKESIAKDCHVRFEKIHPFGDGNGRVGRILYNIHRLNLGLPLHIIYEKDKYEYLKWFE